MRKSKVLSFVLVAALAVTAIPINAFGTVSDEKNKLSDLQNQKQQAQDENNKLQKSKSDAQEYIQSIDPIKPIPAPIPSPNGTRTKKI